MTKQLPTSVSESACFVLEEQLKNYMTKHCNQCGEEMHTVFEATKTIIVGFCANPECPNYALVQIPAENMPEEEK